MPSSVDSPPPRVVVLADGERGRLIQQSAHHRPDLPRIEHAYPVLPGQQRSPRTNDRRQQPETRRPEGYYGFVRRNPRPPPGIRKRPAQKGQVFLKLYDRGQGRGRTGDLPLFRRTLYQLSYLARTPVHHRNAVATLTGLEPATFAVTGRRANQLRHRALTRYSVIPECSQRDSNPRCRLERAES